MVSAWWLLVAASLGFCVGFLLVAAFTMLRDERSESDEQPVSDTTPQHT